MPKVNKSDIDATQLEDAVKPTSTDKDVLSQRMISMPGDGKCLFWAAAAGLLDKVLYRDSAIALDEGTLHSVMTQVQTQITNKLRELIADETLGDDWRARICAEVASDQRPGGLEVDADELAYIDHLQDLRKMHLN